MVHTIFSDKNCFMPSVTIDGKGGHELKLEKKMGQFFLVLTPCLQKLPKKTMASAEI